MVGMAVTSRHFEPGVVWDAARRGEKWIYSLERALGPRNFAFSNATTHLGESQVQGGGHSDLQNLPHSVVFPFGKLATCRVWDGGVPKTMFSSWKVGL